jgi:hypothetical protein
MLIKDDFETWLAALCDFYSRGDWFVTKNIDACWKDIRGVDLEALEEIGKWIRSNFMRWPDGFSVSAAIHKGWKVVLTTRARESAKLETPETPSQDDMRRFDEHASVWIPRIRAMVAQSQPRYMQKRTDESGLERRRRT